ncbi:MFS transporter, partial [Streptomyces sp. SID7499]|nr:MFS transporter [Streptomyces sp. SID7499]
GCFVLGSVIVAVALPRGTGRPAVDPSAAADTQEPGYWRRFVEGFTFLRGDPLLLAVIVVVGITNLLDAALTTLMVPVWAEESGNGPAAIGLVSTALGAAAVGGSLIAAMAAHRLPRRAVFLVGFLLAGAPRFLVLAVDAPLGVVLA